MLLVLDLDPVFDSILHIDSILTAKQRIMKTTYIYLNEQDKAKLTKQAQSKQLSVSTYVDIIMKHYNILLTEKQQTEYINKGCKKVHLKLRAKTYDPKDITATNSVYLYLHKENRNLPINYEKINRMIQSDSDKTIDSAYMKNQIIRASIYISKGIKTK